MCLYAQELPKLTSSYFSANYQHIVAILGEVVGNSTLKTMKLRGRLLYHWILSFRGVPACVRKEKSFSLSPECVPIGPKDWKSFPFWRIASR
jgi:hypothetical protein